MYGQRDIQAKKSISNPSIKKIQYNMKEKFEKKNHFITFIVWADKIYIYIYTNIHMQ